MQSITTERLSHRFRAMGTEITLSLWPRAGGEADARRALARESVFLRRAEQRLSRFLPESEISRLNHAGGDPVRVSRLTFAAVVAALDAAEASGGLFDPTIHDALVAAGYDRSFEQLGSLGGPFSLSSPQEQATSPLMLSLSKHEQGAVLGSPFDRLRVSGIRPAHPEPVHSAHPEPVEGQVQHERRLHPSESIGNSCSRFSDVRLDPTARTVTLPAGVRLDLGGIAKGWLADQTARRLGRYGAVLADLGGDIAVRGLPPNEPAWRIGLVADAGPDLLGQIALTRGGVATSGVTRRRWQSSAGWQHHLIDPRTGRPALTDLRSVSVVAPSATVAEAAAKAVLLLGAEAGREALAQTPDLGAVLVLANGAIQATGSVAWQPAAPAACIGGHAS